MLYSACTSMDTMMGVQILGTSLPMGIAPSIWERSCFCIPKILSIQEPEQSGKAAAHSRTKAHPI